MTNETRPKATVTVDAADLREILVALNGPAHYIRELQVIRSLGNNPIDRLIEQFNAQVAPQEPSNDQ